MDYFIIIITVIAFLIIPGYLGLSLVSRGFSPRDKLFYAPFTSISILSIAIFIFSNLGFSFYLLHFFILILIFTLLLILKGIITQKRLFSLSKIDIQNFKRAIWFALIDKNSLFLIIPVLILLIMQIIAFWGKSFPLPADDPIFHYYYIQEITRTGQILKTGFYPFGMHTILSLIYQLTRFPIEKILMTSTILVVCMMPFSLYKLAKIINGQEKVALVTALITPLFSLWPIRPYIWGAYPFLWGLVFLWQYCAFFIKTLKKPILRDIFINIFLGIGLFFLHAPEFVTAWVFLGCYLVTNLSLLKNYKNILLITSQFLIIGVVYKLLSYREIGLVITESIRKIDISLEQKFLQFFVYGFSYFIVMYNLFIVVFSLIGFLHVVKRKEKNLLPIVFYLLVIFFIYVDIIFFQKLNFLYRLFDPWAGCFRFIEFIIFPICFLGAVSLTKVPYYYLRIKEKGLRFLILMIFGIFVIIPLLIGTVYFKETISNRTPDSSLLKIAQWFNNNQIKNTTILNIPYIFEKIDKTQDSRPADFMGWLEVLTENKLTFGYLSLSTYGSKEYQNKLILWNSFLETSDQAKIRNFLKKQNVHYLVWSNFFQQSRKTEFTLEKLKSLDFLEFAYVSDETCKEDQGKNNCSWVFKVKPL